VPDPQVQQIQDDFDAAVVAIEIGGRVCGAGFFATERLVVTLALPGSPLVAGLRGTDTCWRVMVQASSPCGPWTSIHDLSSTASGTRRATASQ
jgi:hypothetical protein